jgi:hypothetical protein
VWIFLKSVSGFNDYGHMAIDLKIFETHLRRYAVLYFMLGLIERELRVRSMITLSGLASEKGYAEWVHVVPSTKGNIKSINTAFTKNFLKFEGIEEHMTFSFWRHLFDGKNFTLLWVPALHSIFPSLENPLTKKSFAQVGNHLTKANRIRNRVAHYEIRVDSDYEGEKEVLMWIIRKMDGVSS